MKHFLIILFLLVSSFTKAEIYNFSRLDNTHGLSNNQINCILKDSRGFMWFGTNFGLNRYDGYNVKVYKSIKNDSTSLIYNSIPRIQEDIRGNLWITGNIWIPGNTRYVIYDILTEKFNRNIAMYVSTLGIHFNPALIEISPQKDY